MPRNAAHVGLLLIAYLVPRANKVLDTGTLLLPSVAESEHYGCHFPACSHTTPFRAQRDIVLPISEPIRGIDGTLIPEVVVPKGAMVLTYFAACNTDKAIWGEDVLVWKPERWLSPLPRTVEEARIPGIYSHQ